MPTEPERFLKTWKEIAKHLNVGVRTAQLWEKNRGLPVHRITGDKSQVRAIPEELNAWLMAQDVMASAEREGVPGSNDIGAADRTQNGQREDTAANDATNSALSPGSPPAGQFDTDPDRRNFWPKRTQRPFLISAAGVTVAIISFSIWRFMAESQSSPQVIDAKPVTHSGLPKYAPILTSGGEVYFTELAGGHYRIVRVPDATGRPTEIQTSISNPYLCDLSSDGKRLLIRSVEGGFDDFGPLYVQPLDDKPAEQLPLTAFDGVWAPGAFTWSWSPSSHENWAPKAGGSWWRYGLTGGLWP